MNSAGLPLQPTRVALRRFYHSHCNAQEMFISMRCIILGFNFILQMGRFSRVRPIFGGSVEYQSLDCQRNPENVVRTRFSQTILPVNQANGAAL